MKRWLFLLLIIMVGLMQGCSKHENPVGPPGPAERNIQFSGRITGTFSGRVMAGATVRVEVEGQNSAEVMTDGGGSYSVRLKYIFENGKPVPVVKYRISGAGIRFVRETSYQSWLASDAVVYDIDCIENSGDGANFDLSLYRKLNSYEDGNSFPTLRWYPDFPEVYIVRTAGVSDWQYQQVREGIAKISQFSRGAIPALKITTVTEEPPDRTGKVVHKWVDDNQLPGDCASTDTSLYGTYSIAWSLIKYKKKEIQCSISSFHEMMHGMIEWPGLDRGAGMMDNYRGSLQIYFAYKRFPGHTFDNAIDKDNKPK